MKTTITSSTSSMSFPHQPTNYDEFFMNKSLIFSDSLKDLKNLRTQLYSAADYFEVSYTNDDQKETMVDTLKDYTIKALVNTVDHLGSITFKVNDLVDENIDQVSATEFQVSSIEHRLQTCQTFIDHEGLTQQSLVVKTPKHYKRYILPEGESRWTPNDQGYNREDEENWKKLKEVVRARYVYERESSIRNTRSSSPEDTEHKHQEPGPNNEENWKKLKKAVREPEKNTQQCSIGKARSNSPFRSMFPLLRSGSTRSVSSRSTTPVPSRPLSSGSTKSGFSRSLTPFPNRSTTPNSFNNTKKQHPSEPQKTISKADYTDKRKEVEHQSSKSKLSLKALLRRRKSKKDEVLFTYLDEY